MFDDVRQAFRDLLRGTPPSGDARRSIVAQMRETLVQARMGLDDLRKGIEETRARLQRERSELETVRRRKQLAQGINDAQTVAIAERYEKQHAERAGLLERKLETQEAELAMVEREVGEMNAEFKLAAAGANPGCPPDQPRGARPPADRKTTWRPTRLVFVTRSMALRALGVVPTRSPRPMKSLRRSSAAWGSSDRAVCRAPGGPRRAWLGFVGDRAGHTAAPRGL
jgi:hypothetical protein